MATPIDRVRPSRSPSQPNNHPPAAAPNRNAAWYHANHRVTTGSGVSGPSRSSDICRWTRTNSEISSPANIHARNAAARTARRPDRPRVGVVTAAALTWNYRRVIGRTDLNAPGAPAEGGYGARERLTGTPPAS